MAKKSTVIVLVMLLLAGSCKNLESRKTDPNEMTNETEKMATAYTFLLKKLQEDNLNLIAGRNNENLSLIKDIIRTNNFDLEVENYDNIQREPDLCYYSKSTKRTVAIIDVSKRKERTYYISYYIGPEGGASKEILITKRNEKWVVANDDGIWAVK